MAYRIQLVMTRKTLFRILLLSIILLFLIPSVIIRVQRPPSTPIQSQLFSGVTYQRQPINQPRTVMLHILEIDLTSPDVQFFVTPATDTSDNLAYPAQTTTEFLETYQLQAAINANFFFPFRSGTPWNYYPKPQEPVTAVGLAISDGTIYSSYEANFPVLCLNNNSAEILRTNCPAETEQAVAGDHLFIWNGEIKNYRYDIPYPRTVIALSEDRKTMWWLVADGRQRGYSEGAMLAELGELLLELGATTALNLDGGGSTSMAIMDGSEPVLLNSPVHTRIPLRQRPIAVHLGLIAPSLDVQ